MKALSFKALFLKFCCILVFLIPVSPLIVPEAAYAARPPKVRIKVRPIGKRKVRINVILSKSAKKIMYRVEIGRAVGTSNSFTGIAYSHKPRRKYRVFDRPSTPGVYGYVARVITTSNQSVWSNGRRIRFRGGKSVKPTPKPTAQPTPRPTAKPSANETPEPNDPSFHAGQRACPKNYRDKVIQYTNETRARLGLSALKKHSQLTWSAQAHNVDMTRGQILKHGNWQDYVRASGFKGTVWLENIAQGQTSPGGVMNDWIESPGHYKNITDKRIKYIGVGCVIGRKGKYWWVQNFGG